MVDTKKIAELCKTHGITKRSLEKLLGFGFRSIDGWEDHEPSVSKVLKVAKFFGVKIEELMTD